ncbi:TetR family transcriptional regulator [Mycobacterium avium subsp. paratuberculosis S5]|nr:TetR family transcriptional regulator [Mycobacterium avium subsp. paratuberculosis S5]
MTTHSTDGRADATRQQILRAASHQFARRPYHDVGLDDILAEAELTKGAMYFHFKSKHALAVAIIESQTASGAVAVQDLLTRGLSGLETLIDFSYLIAVKDIKTDLVRSGLNLMESVGLSDGLQEKLFDRWIKALARVAEQAKGEGDINEHCDPQDIGRLMVSLHMGLRKTSNLDARNDSCAIWRSAGRCCSPGSCSRTAPSTSNSSCAGVLPSRSTPVQPMMTSPSDRADARSAHPTSLRGCGGDGPPSSV